jgi:hypothetical protein
MMTPTITTASNHTASARTPAPLAALRRVNQRRQADQRLRRELAEYRTPAERAEIQAIYARHDAALPPTFYRRP